MNHSGFRFHSKSWFKKTLKKHVKEIFFSDKKLKLKWTAQMDAPLKRKNVIWTVFRNDVKHLKKNTLTREEKVTPKFHISVKTHVPLLFTMYLIH